MQEKWIITPGLLTSRKELLVNLVESKKDKMPILIYGPRGVGKSLFIDIAKQYFKKELSINEPVVVNCSHFDDPTIARSEIFGHKKGSFTGASEHKEGFLSKAHDNVLILEEVGDLPRTIQAKLLTFIEDGYYYALGGTKKLKSDVRIIAVTNNTENLRSDFKDRFSEFQIPPLYVRREDILYYLSFFDHSLLKNLRANDLLSLLAYDWPGNVRELYKGIKEIEKNITLNKMEQENCDFPSSGGNISINKPIIKLKKQEVSEDVSHFFAHPHIDTFIARLTIKNISSLATKLSEYGINMSDIESIFNGYISLRLMNAPDVGITANDICKTEKCSLNFNCVNGKVKKFGNVYSDFQNFCNLFGLNPEQKQDLLVGALESEGKECNSELLLNKLPNNAQDGLKAFFRNKTNTIGEELIEELANLRLSRGDKDSFKDHENKSFFKGLEVEVLKRVVDKCSGIPQASKRLGIKERTLRSKLPSAKNF